MKLQSIIEAKIKSLNPIHFELTNESHLHEGHIPGHHEESHFRLVMVSEKFIGLNRVQRQRLIYDLLADEFKANLHALTMKLMSPDEYASK